MRRLTSRYVKLPGTENRLRSKVIWQLRETRFLERLIADSAFGSDPMLGRLVDRKVHPTFRYWIERGGPTALGARPNSNGTQRTTNTFARRVRLNNRRPKSQSDNRSKEQNHAGHTYWADKIRKA